MKGLRLLGDRRSELADFPHPELQSGWAVVRTTMSAVCGSDLHIYRQDAEQVGSRSNRVAGHEAVGVIEELAPGVEGLAPGDRVVVYQHYGCNRCAYCRAGEPMFCPERKTLGNHINGADAEFVAVPAMNCLPLPDSLSDEVAALMGCNFGTAFSGVSKLQLEAGDVAVVYGLGPVGCCGVTVAAGSGADVIAVDPVKGRRGLAETLGAAWTLDPTTSDTRALIRDMTQGRGAEAVIDCSGNPQAQSEALDIVRPKGRVLVLGANDRMVVNPGTQLIRKEITLLGSWVYRLGEYEAMVRLAEKRRDALATIVTRSFDGSEAEDALRAADGLAEGKIVIDWT
jgi:L-iditol 2-dehydrogenase